MKFRFLLKCSVILLSMSLNLRLIQCSTDNSGLKKTLRMENSQKISDYEENVGDGEKNQEEKNVDENSSHIPGERDHRIVRRVEDFEFAKLELEKIEKNVKNEIHNLEKLYEIEKTDNKRQINKNIKFLKFPKSVTRQVHAYKIDNERVVDHSNLVHPNDRSLSVVVRSADGVKANQSPNESKESTTGIETSLLYNEKENVDNEKIENAIQRKIDAIKINVGRQIAEEQEHKKIRGNNAKKNGLQKINSANTLKQKNNQRLNFFAKRGLGSRKTRKQAAPFHKLNSVTKSTFKNVINHNKIKKFRKSISKPEKASVNIGNKSSIDLDPQQQLFLLKSKKLGNRLTRRLRKRPGINSSSNKNLQNNHNRKIRYVNKPQNITPNTNFLFHEKFHDKKKFKRTTQSEYEQRKINHQTNGCKFRWRKARAIDNPSYDTKFKSMVESNDLNNAIDLPDIDSQLMSEYKESFGSFPSGSDDVSFIRYKRV